MPRWNSKTPIIPAASTKKPKFCKHCNKLVSITIANLGYCKECFEEARQRNTIFGWKRNDN